jgi:archaellum component FlaC
MSSDNLKAQPAIETVLERLNTLGNQLSSQLTAFAEQTNKRLDAHEQRLNRVDSRLDRIESMMLELRADFRDLKDALKEHLPALK